MPKKLWHNVLMGETTSIPVQSPVLQFDLKAVENGVPLSALARFAACSGFELSDLLEVVIPARTLKHRRERKEPLNLDESDRLARVVRLYDLAVKVFGNPEKVRHWLSKPKTRFDERTPLAMMRTELGGRQVEEWLIQIDEGMFA
ncbi:MAG: antitoxin Xre/MbcA/ParS toxin-binding domain-containing protein [Terracidiphilus sp.]